jgi:thiol:disulfide interchange protein DsbC
MRLARVSIAAAILLSALLSGPAFAQSGTVPPAAVPKDPKAALLARFPDVRPELITPSPVAGIYEVRVGSRLTYVSADGRYMMKGEIIDLNTKANITETRLMNMRKTVLAGLKDDAMVVFAPARYKHTVTVFTDTDCGYCRKLHSQMADYNSRGIRVRYLAFPRNGPNTPAWKQAEQVWCAKDKRGAMTRAKLGIVLKDPVCKNNPVAMQYQMARDFGLQGTPAIVLESGELIGGYLEPAELADYLAETAAPGKG